MADETPPTPPQPPQPRQQRLSPAQTAALTAVANEISATLHERAKEGRWQIRQITLLRGEEFARQLLAETLAVEAQGGMPSARGGRRTPGGVYLRLARTRLTPGETTVVFAHIPKAITYLRPPKALPNAQALRPAASVKVTVIGRPAAAARLPDCVAIRLTTGAMPPLPKGLPPAPGPMDVTVYVSMKHWPKVEAQLQAHPEDVMIANGFIGYDKAEGVTVVYAINATTKLLLAERQALQKAENVAQ
jgi:PHAX RNA-binding domain